MIGALLLCTGCLWSVYPWQGRERLPTPTPLRAAPSPTPERTPVLLYPGYDDWERVTNGGNRVGPTRTPRAWPERAQP
jgi:hypothetical protein